MITALTLWLAASILVAWLAGRFIRVGMVDLQPIKRSDLHEKLTVIVPKPTRYYRDAQLRAMNKESQP